MRIIKRLFAPIVVGLACSAFVVFHHGWSNYDQDKVQDYTGTVQELTYENPHATAKVQHKKKTWTVILAPVTRMEARGVKEEMLKKGSSIRVVGYPHKEIKDEMRAERIYVNGEKFELR